MLFKKSDFSPLGLELNNFKNNFESLSPFQKQLWLERIKQYYKKDKLREHIHLKSYIEEII